MATWHDVVTSRADADAVAAKVERIVVRQPPSQSQAYVSALGYLAIVQELRAFSILLDHRLGEPDVRV